MLTGLVQHGKCQCHTVLAEDLVVLRIAAAVPLQATWRRDKPDSASLAATFGHAPLQSANPTVYFQPTQFNELDATSCVDGLTVAQV
jgi:hypothetical protein